VTPPKVKVSEETKSEETPAQEQKNNGE
jgi:hypothetical protein